MMKYLWIYAFIGIIWRTWRGEKYQFVRYDTFLDVPAFFIGAATIWPYLFVKEELLGMSTQPEPTVLIASKPEDDKE